jgi:hypothetical protein
LNQTTRAFIPDEGTTNIMARCAEFQFSIAGVEKNARADTSKMS